MKWVLLIWSFFLYKDAHAQTLVKGRVTDTHHRGLYGVSISLKDSYDGATSNSEGYYSFVTRLKGAHLLEATSSGYKTFEDSIFLGGDSIQNNIQMKESITALKAVVISAGTFAASDQKRGSVLKPLDIVTTASANADITGALKTLPGTQQVGESEGLFVRGGTANESKIFIDGTLVNNFFYTSEPGLATRGRFNPFLFKGTIFSTGGYSALYGQALSSVLLLQSIDLPEKSSATLGLSYLAGNAGFQKLAKDHKSSWGMTYSYTNLSLVYNLIRQKFDYFKVPVLQEGDANFRIKTSPTGMLKYFGSFSTTKVGFRNPDVDSLELKDAFSLRNIYMYHNLSYKEKWAGRWGLEAGVSYNNNHDQIDEELQDAQNQKLSLSFNPLYAYKNYSLVNKGNYLNGKVVFEKKWAALNALRFGTEYNYSDEKSEYTQYDGIRFPQDVREHILAGFGESDIYLTNNIAAKVGVRTEHSSLLNRWNLAPRISVAYKFRDEGQFSLAYGLFYEDPERKYLPSLNQLHFAEATHYIAQYQKMTADRTFRTEIFYKKYKDLFKTGLTAYGTFQAINNQGFGDAKGIEFFWRDKKSIPNLDYWVSYSYLDTKRDFLNYPFAIEPSFATRHTASLVVKKFMTPLKTEFNASYTFATGRPYYDIAFDSASRSFHLRNQGVTRNYNDLSLSVNFLPSVGKQHAKSFIVYVLSLTNVLGAKNVYTYNYSANGQHKTAVTPPSTRFLYIGCFISIGVDRSQDEINNHL